MKLLLLNFVYAYEVVNFCLKERVPTTLSEAVSYLFKELVQSC